MGHEYMLLQVSLGRERPAAELALERLLLCMASKVDLESAPAGECLTADLTDDVRLSTFQQRST